jgi:hypothetical protein
VYIRICNGRAVLSQDKLQQLVRRNAPLQQFEELLACTDGLHHVFYVWTGSYLFRDSRCFLESRRIPHILIARAVFTGAQGIGKTTIAEIACSEIMKARPHSQRSVQLCCPIILLSCPAHGEALYVQGVTFFKAPMPGNTEDAKKGFTNSLAAALDFSLLDIGA